MDELFLIFEKWYMSRSADWIDKGITVDEAGLGKACEAWSPLGGTGGNLLQDEVIGGIAQKYGKSSA